MTLYVTIYKFIQFIVCILFGCFSLCSFTSFSIYLTVFYFIIVGTFDIAMLDVVHSVQLHCTVYCTTCVQQIKINGTSVVLCVKGALSLNSICTCLQEPRRTFTFKVCETIPVF